MPMPSQPLLFWCVARVFAGLCLFIMMYMCKFCGYSVIILSLLLLASLSLSIHLSLSFFLSLSLYLSDCPTFSSLAQRLCFCTRSKTPICVLRAAHSLQTATDRVEVSRTVLL